MTTSQQTERVLSLRDIVQYELPALFRRHHLGREMVTGLVGLRGEGKSLGGSVLVLLDYMVEGVPCFSNMKIKCTFDIDDSIAWKYGLEQGGRVTFESEQLDRESLLRFDPKYANAVLFIDEINMEFAESRRSSSNVNLWFDRVGAQLRKRNLSLVYTCIHEMWVDPRIRESLTDVFILCHDTALSPEGLAQKRQLGTDFKWTIYPMTRMLTGESYYDTRRSLAPVYLHGRKFWGTFDTYEVQAEGKYKYTMDIGKGQVPVDFEMEESQQVIEVRSQWGWLYEKILALHNQPVEEILDDDLWAYLQVKERGLSTKEVGKQLAAMGITKYQVAHGYNYVIPMTNLTQLPISEKKVGVLIKR